MRIRRSAFVSPIPPTGREFASASDKPQGPYTIVVRDDGRRQWAYRGKPVYTWPEDQEPGDKYGDNYNKVWHIVR